MNMNEMASVQIQISKEIDTYFEMLAKETDTSKSFHIEKALNDYLKPFRKLPFRCDDAFGTGTEKAIGPPAGLDKLDVTVNTRNDLIEQLRKVKADNERKKRLNSPFLHSSPADLGYTDASLLDKIISGES